MGCRGNEIKLFGLNISPISADHSDSFSPYFVTQDSEICQLPARFKLDRKSGKCHLFTSQGANPKVYPRGQKNEGKGSIVKDLMFLQTICEYLPEMAWLIVALCNLWLRNG